MTTHNDPRATQHLSKEGLRRRDEILSAAQQALADRTRRRRSRSSLGAVALLAAATGLALSLMPSSPQERRQRESDIVALDDDALLDQLASLGIDASLVTIDGEALLVGRDGRPLELPLR
jgi:hypothetical protein